MTSFINNSYNIDILYKNYIDNLNICKRINNLLYDIGNLIDDQIRNNKLLIKTKLSNPNILSDIYNLYGVNFLNLCEKRLKQESNSEIKKNFSFKNLKIQI